MGCTVLHYWQEHVERIEEKLSVAVESEATVDLIDGDELRGVIHARVYFHDEDAYLDVFERVEVTDRPHRLKYSYNLRVDGELIARHDFDPKLPDELQHHINRPGDVHDPSERISLAKMISLSWDLITDFREAYQGDAETE